MKIEHLAFQVEDPAAMADWYAAQLGFAVKRAGDLPFPVHFLADSSGQVLLELYNNPTLSVPDYGSIDRIYLEEPTYGSRRILDELQLPYLLRGLEIELSNHV